MIISRYQASLARLVALAAVGVIASVACGDDSEGGGASPTDGGGGSGGDATGGGGSGGGAPDASTSGAGGTPSVPDADAAEAGAFDEGYDTPATVTVADGVLEGRTNGESRRFLGIPYAQPPVGDLRWKPPVANDPWQGTRDATEFGGRCVQPSSIQNDMPSENEDCLYLNVWTPDPAPSAPAPVLFWIHGGGNVTGATSDPVPLGVGRLFYNGRSFAETHGAIVVTINYRLGVMGFFSHPSLTAEGSSSGNQGLLDQKLALEWVRDNIAAFGGDPGNVTVFGESAGSFNTCFHVASPESAGLFHRAISESGGCTTLLRTSAEAEAEAAAYVDAVGCSASADVLACLRGKPVAELTIDAPLVGGPADGGVLPGGDRYQGSTELWSFGPVVDGTMLPDQPRVLFDAGTVNQVDYILGSNSDEGTLFHLGATPVADEAEYLAALQRAYGTDAAAILAAYPVSAFASADAALQRVTGDSRLVCGTHDTARRAAAAGLNVYMYNFDLPIAVAGFEFLGAVHGAEIAYVFNDIEMWPNVLSETVSTSIHAYWGRFAATGDPNGGGAPAWPQFSATNDQRMQFGDPIAVVDDFRSAECTVWRSIYDAAFTP